MKENEMENLSEKFLKISKAILAWLTFVILFPFLLLLFGVLCFWKYGVLWVVVRLFKRKFLEGFEDSETFYAVDRYWESSRSSVGLIVELEGSINIDTFRDEFRKKVLDFTFHPDLSQDQEDASPPRRPFAKLMQIPATFAGYYYWQKANYFLIHEHIRQINQPTDELGLKKAVGTLMTLPFPNRRPLWEILVYSNYVGSTTTVGDGTTSGSALFIRIHRAVTDTQGLVNMIRLMLTDKSIKPLDVPVSGEDVIKVNETTIQKEKVEGVYKLLYTKVTSLLYFPLRIFQFAQQIVKVPEGIAQSKSDWDATNASWTNLSDVLMRKMCASQIPRLSRSAVEIALYLEGMTSTHKCLNVPEEKGVPVQEGKCQICVLASVPGLTSTKEQLLTNDKSFITVKSPCFSSLTCTKSTVLKSLQQQLKLGDNGNDHNIFRIYLRLLSLLPRHILRYLLISKKWGAESFIYEQFPDIEGLDKMDKEEHKLFGLYQVSHLVPLVGLQWTHTVASATTLKWQGNIVMSLIANAGILGPMNQLNPQEHAERIIRGFSEELDRLSEDAEDHGFVSIPIS